MRKVFVIITLGLLTISCQKESPKESEATGSATLTVTAVIDRGTRTSIDGTEASPKPVWNEGDEILLFGTGGDATVFELTEGAGTSSGTFRMKDGETLFSGAFACAYYPADGADSFDGTNISATIPSSQNYVIPSKSDADAGTFGNGSFPMTATGTWENSNLNLTFSNVFGILQLNFTSDALAGSISQIDLAGPAGLSGTAEISPGANPACSISGCTGVSLKADTPVTLSGSDPTAFYIAVPPGTVSKVYVTTDKGVFEKSVSKTIARSRIKSINASTLSAAGFSKITYSGAAASAPQPVAGTVWAPVNCGYDSDHPSGLLYQWGSNSGLGYNDEAPATWSSWTGEGDLWGVPKTASDPCPEGWRVPTSEELNALAESGDYASLLEFPGYKKSEDGISTGSGSGGYYWSSDTSGTAATALVHAYLDFSSSTAYLYGFSRASGLSVRCVKEN